ncbi:hypothetical protein ACUOCP_34825 [Escherichia sp. R-CC3]
MRKALENDQLVIHYQPKITWRGEVRSLEALVRWQSTDRFPVLYASWYPARDIQIPVDSFLG